MVQYHNLPDHNWSVLRNEHPGMYEAEIPSPPAPTEWFNVRIEVEVKMIAVYVNNQSEPVLSVESLSNRTEGKIGLWVGNNSLGRFANVSIEDK